MQEYFVRTNSFAAPFFSDTDTQFSWAETAGDALIRVASGYKHPCGLYAAVVYKDANAYHKGEKPLARWLSNHAKFLDGKLGIIKSNGPGYIEFDSKEYKIENPFEGAVYPV